jgi:hypothetical protein
MAFYAHITFKDISIHSKSGTFDIFAKHGAQK